MALMLAATASAPARSNDTASPMSGSVEAVHRHARTATVWPAYLTGVAASRGSPDPDQHEEDAARARSTIRRSPVHGRPARVSTLRSLQDALTCTVAARSRSHTVLHT